MTFPWKSQGFLAEPGWPVRPRGPVSPQLAGRGPAAARRGGRQQAGVDAGAGWESLLLGGRERRKKAVLEPRPVTRLAGFLGLRRFHLLRDKCLLHPLTTDLSLRGGRRHQWRHDIRAHPGDTWAPGSLASALGSCSPPAAGRRGFRRLTPPPLDCPSRESGDHQGQCLIGLEADSQISNSHGPEGGTHVGCPGVRAWERGFTGNNPRKQAGGSRESQPRAGSISKAPTMGGSSSRTPAEAPGLSA